eukprot:6212544-Pleurochrysis_carterae.AAC.4
MVDASTPSDPLDWLAPWNVTLDDSSCMMRDMKVADHEGRKRRLLLTSAGQDIVDSFTPSHPVSEWLAPWEVTFKDLCRRIRDLKAADRKGRDGLSPGQRKRLERSQRSGTPKATIPFGMRADDAPSPCYPQNLASE